MNDHLTEIVSEQGASTTRRPRFWRPRSAVLGVLALARKHGATVAEEGAQAALELGLPTYRFLRRYLERRTHVPLTLKQVDPLIRQLSIYRDLIDQKTGDLS